MVSSYAYWGSLSSFAFPEYSADRFSTLDFPFEDELRAKGLLPLSVTADDIERLAQKNTQRVLTRAAEELFQKELLANCSDHLVDRIKTYSIRGSGLSNGWLTTLPISPSLRLITPHFQSALRLRYNIRQIDPKLVPYCHCKAKMTELHPFACRSSDVIARHNGISLVLKNAASRAGLQVVMERPFLHGSRTLKPDLVVMGLCAGFYMSWVDVSVCHPHMTSYESKSAAVVVKERAMMKLKKYHAALPSFNANCYPAVLDVFGRPSRFLLELIGAISTQAGQNRDFEDTVFANYLKAELSCALQRGNALIMTGAAVKSLVAHVAASESSF